LNNRGFALAYWGFAFSDATSKPEGENYRTHREQQFSHRESPRTKCMIGIVNILVSLTSAGRPHLPNNLSPLQ
jgi:hypothetical protein